MFNFILNLLIGATIGYGIFLFGKWSLSLADLIIDNGPFIVLLTLILLLCKVIWNFIKTQIAVFINKYKKGFSTDEIFIYIVVICVFGLGILLLMVHQLNK